MEDLVQSYAEGFNRLSVAIEGLSEELLLYKPAENRWCIKKVVIHLCDAEMIALDRMKRIIAEPNPLFFKFDPDAWALRLQYSSLDMSVFLSLFAALRASMVPILRGLSEEDWARTGVHNQNGKLTLQELVAMFVHHLDRHIQQIERNKKAFAEQR
ncbi:DinB family protein [Paenibacillus filicis]|uniref:DinB family protein n=1 Tax=Paenibacillus gyeongsangnamensis TaxID=3388067 RepID=A0ABT4QG87_9BACL|nr:DinB family protein [Paenibacillus filicis]MCZ8515867.1 DinB family protein [Paenibacillus filicis]